MSKLQNFKVRRVFFGAAIAAMSFSAASVAQASPKMAVQTASFAKDSAIATAIDRNSSNGHPLVAQNVPVVTQQETTPSAPQNVTSTSQFSDVQSTTWAFPALQALVERYGCIAGYPDRTYRGQRPLSRYEFAAGLSACLDKVNEIFNAKLDQKASKEELAAVQADVETLKAGLQRVTQELAALSESVKRYFVIVPSASNSDLEKARSVVPSARIASSRLGSYILLQGFNKRSYAEALNSQVRSKGLNSRVIYEN